VPPIDICNRVDPRAHLTSFPNPVDVLAKRRPNRQLVPWQGGASRAASSQGSPGDDSPFRRPRDDRSPRGFTPIRLQLGHPHVAMLTPAPTGMVDDGDLRWRSLSREDQLALAAQAEAWPRPRPWLAVRAAVTTAPRERRGGRLHPGCLPPIPSSRRRACALGS
jgi:hypothetical protein